MEDNGLEHPPKSSGKKGVRQKSGAESGALHGKTKRSVPSVDGILAVLTLALEGEGIGVDVVEEIRQVIHRHRAESARRGLQIRETGSVSNRQKQ
jgi:hypothetical protein